MGVHLVWARTEARRRRIVRASWVAVGSAGIVAACSAFLPLSVGWMAVPIVGSVVAGLWPVGDTQGWAMAWISRRDGLAYATAWDRRDDDAFGFRSRVLASARSSLRAGGAPPASRAWLTPAVCACLVAALLVAAWDADQPGTLDLRLGSQARTDGDGRVTPSTAGPTDRDEGPNLGEGLDDTSGTDAAPEASEAVPARERGSSVEAPPSRDGEGGQAPAQAVTGDDAVRRFLDDPFGSRAPQTSGEVAADPVSPVPAPATSTGATSATGPAATTSVGPDATDGPNDSNAAGGAPSAGSSGPSPATTRSSARGSETERGEEGARDASDGTESDTGTGGDQAVSPGDDGRQDVTDPNALQGDDTQSTGGRPSTTEGVTGDDRRGAIGSSEDPAADDASRSGDGRSGGADEATESRNPFSSGMQGVVPRGGAPADGEDGVGTGTAGSDGASTSAGTPSSDVSDTFAAGTDGAILRLDGDLADDGTTFVVPVGSAARGREAPPAVDPSQPPSGDAVARAEVDAENQGLPGAYREIIRRYFRSP